MAKVALCSVLALVAATQAWWVGPFNTDIEGTGLGGSKESSAADCQARCEATPKCRAIEYSATDVHDDGNNCFIFDNQDDSSGQYLTFQIWKYDPPSPPKACPPHDTWTGPWNTDIEGTGLGGSKESSADDCKARCAAEPSCNAMEYSGTDVHDDGNNCFLFDNQDDTSVQYLTFQIWKLDRACKAASPGGPHDVPGCIMANTNAINDMVDSALFIYASVKSCGGKTFVKGKPCATTDIKANVCVANIASVVNSMLGVGEFLIKVFKSCGEIATSNYDCALAGTKLSASLAAVTSNAAWAAGDCKPPGDSMKSTGKYHTYNWTYADLDTCTVKVGAAMSGLQSAISSMMTVKKKCDEGDGGKCFSAVLDIISAVGNLAVFIENVVANCNHHSVSVANACATDIGGILSGLAATASTAITIKSSCTPESTRLYQNSDAPAAPTPKNANLLSAMLVVFLPIIGLASYHGGSRFSRGRQARCTNMLSVVE